MRLRWFGIPALALALTACARGGPVDPAVLAPPSAGPSASALPPLQLPQDDAPHDALTEWWYYTGHLAAAGGKAYGFELVIFQGNRANDPTAYAAHFAVTDNTRGQFQFAERTAAGSQVHAGPGYDLNMNGWLVGGTNGHDHLTADMPDYAIDLDLASLKPAALHGGDGIISFGPAGDSYYYSRTRLDLHGTLSDHGQPLAVTGLAWMDHQWGNFITGAGGWDWFAIQLDDETEMMLFFLRDAAGKDTQPYGTLVDGSGRETLLPPGSFSERSASTWTSPTTGVTYPSGWTVDAGGAQLTLTPTVVDQELNPLRSTGFPYWEGDVTISGTKAGRTLTGQGYVELVGYNTKR
ncbi:MAG: carotenoid 1,2-hydratase [Chloroflexi bacterium]|nr:carotenoid 1,2-hydratase [Chloroflexota bacterium]